LIRFLTRSSWFSRLLFAAYFIEVGLLLVFAPWSAFWDRNVFSRAIPLVGLLMHSPFVRGAVSGLGLVSLSAGVGELFALVASWRR
jgi:hypothetical protein